MGIKLYKLRFLDIVKLLLMDSRVNVADSHNSAFQRACVAGHEQIVELLLLNSNVDPCDVNNSAINGAIRNGHENIVRLLLDDIRIDPSTQDNESLKVNVSLILDRMPL